MKRKLVLISLLVAGLAWPQITTRTAWRVRSGPTLPATCSAALGEVFWKTGAGIGIYTCPVDNNWALLAGAGGLAAHIADTSAHSSTALNTPSRIVLRDGAGNFAAGVITANLTGNVSGTSLSHTGNHTGDVTSIAMGTTVAAVGGVTAANVAAGANLANAGTDANTASAIVRRSAGGNFSAGTITAALTGNAQTASALAADPTDCGAGNFATSIAASGNLGCAAPSGSGYVLGGANLTTATRLMLVSAAGTATESPFITCTGSPVTCLWYDPTAVTGTVTLTRRAGAAQGDYDQWRDVSDVLKASVDSGGGFRSAQAFRLGLGTNNSFAIQAYYSTPGIYHGNAIVAVFSSDATWFGTPDLGYKRSSPGIFKITNGSTGSGAIDAGPGATVPAWAIYTIPYTNDAFKTAATAVSVVVFQLPAKGAIQGIRLKHSVAFAGTGITSVTCSLGDGTSHTAYAPAFDVFQAVSNTAQAWDGGAYSTTAAAHNVTARCTANVNFGNGAATVLTAGSLDVHVLWAVLP